MDKFVIADATQMWQKETSLPAIPTFCQNLDKILGTDGVQLGTLTEIIGLPGSGKTLLCLQLCASVQIPKVLGGLAAEALYIDTNTHFTITRFNEILKASLDKCQKVLGLRDEINITDSLKRLHYVNAFGLEKFCALLYTLPGYIRDSNIKLIIIDSISFPFKEGITVKQRTGLLFRLMAELQRIAVEQHIAVVLTNEMSTRIGLSTGSIVGSLGDAWSHRCNSRLLLSLDSHTGKRYAVILKSNITSNAVAEFQITSDGIRDTNETRLNI